MSGYLTCAECDRTFKKLFEDPRSSPLDIGECLCDECTNNAYEEAIEEIEEDLNDLYEQQTTHQTQNK